MGADRYGNTTYLCQCDCGTQKIVKPHDITSGRSNQCRKCWANKLRNENDISGKSFGKWLVITREENDQSGNTRYIVQCKCGIKRSMIAASLTSGKSTQCRRCSSTTHGHNRTPTNRTWIDIRARCYSPNNKGYKNYGGRGITMCDRWGESFENFMQDMGEKPKGLTIDRIDNDGNYEPSNCRWVTRSENNRNRAKRT